MSTNQVESPLRRQLLMTSILGLGSLLAACGRDSTPIPEPSTPVSTPEFSKESVQQKVFEILELYPDRDIKAIYIGGTTSLLDPQVYQLPFDIEALITENNGATLIQPASLSPEPRFDYTDQSGVTVPYQTIDTIQGSIGFSPNWYNFKYPQAKMLSVNAQARQILQDELFAQEVYKLTLNSGKYRIIDQNVSPKEIARTMSYIVRGAFPELDTRFRFGPLLITLQEFDAYKDENNPELMAELGTMVPPWFYDLVKERNINYNVAFGTDEYAHKAFAHNSEWVKLITSPVPPQTFPTVKISPCLRTTGNIFA